MFNLNLRYIFFISCTFAFGILFFTVGFYLPHIKKWKSNKLLNLSKVYQDESISNESNLLADGVRKARIANLLDPSNLETRENFIELLFRANPTEALQKWARIFSVEQVSEERTTTLLKRSIKTLKDDSLEIYEKRIAGEIAIGQLNFLLTIKDWLESPDNALIAAELLAETGNPVRANEIVKKSLENH